MLSSLDDVQKSFDAKRKARARSAGGVNYKQRLTGWIGLLRCCLGRSSKDERMQRIYLDQRQQAT